MKQNRSPQLKGCRRLTIRGLSVEYGSRATLLRALDEISFELGTADQGGTVAVVGASAAGKSSLGLACLGLLPTTARRQGSVVLPGDFSIDRPQNDFRDYRRTSVGVVFQDAPGSLIPGVPIGRQVQRVFGLRRRIGRRDAERQARAALAEVGLEDGERIWRALPAELSGGMSQRVMVCLSVLAAPCPLLLICDEPTSALDSVSAAQVLELLFRVQREHNMVVLFITHDVRLVARFEWVVVLSKGRLVELEKSSRFLSSPASQEGRLLLEASRALGTASMENRVGAKGELQG